MQRRHLVQMLALGLSGASLASPRSPRLFEPGSGAPVRGLFIEHTEVKRALADWVAIAGRVGAAGYTDVFVATTYVGGAHYPSRIPGLARWASSLPENGGSDVPWAATQAFAPLGINVHAVVNAFNASYGVSPGSLEVLRELGLIGLLYSEEDHARRETVSWRGSQFRWLNYNKPETRSRLAAIAAELVASYPALAGVHLDYVRSPGWVSELSDATLARYGTTGWRRLLPAFLGGDDAARAAFDDWQRSNVNDAVRQVAEAIGDRVLSASVFTTEAAPQDHHQDWSRWQRWCDFVMPMIYTDSLAQFERWLRADQAAAAPGQTVVPVIGLHRMAAPTAAEARNVAQGFVDYRLSYLAELR